MTKAALIVTVAILMLMAAAGGQELPGKIGGYKVYDAKISVSNAADNGADDDRQRSVILDTDEPVNTSIGATGIAFEIGAEFTASGHSGRVDRITFHDVRVNGIAVQVDEIVKPFRFTKKKAVRLPQPARVSLGLISLSRAAYDQLLVGTGTLTVTGTAFVFGKFKKFGIGFKRVVPVKFELTFASPLAAAAR